MGAYQLSKCRYLRSTVSPLAVLSYELFQESYLPHPAPQTPQAFSMPSFLPPLLRARADAICSFNDDRRGKGVLWTISEDHTDDKTVLKKRCLAYENSQLQQPQSSRRVNDDKRQADIEAKIRDDMEKAMRKQLEAMREAQEFANAELTRAAQAYLEARDLSLPRYGPSRTSTRQAAQTERLAQRSTQQPTQRSSRRSTKRTFGRVNDEPLRNRLSCHSLTSTERES